MRVPQSEQHHAQVLILMGLLQWLFTKADHTLISTFLSFSILLYLFFIFITKSHPHRKTKESQPSPSTTSSYHHRSELRPTIFSILPKSRNKLFNSNNTHKKYPSKFSIQSISKTNLNPKQTQPQLHKKQIG